MSFKSETCRVLIVTEEGQVAPEAITEWVALHAINDTGCKPHLNSLESHCSRRAAMGISKLISGTCNDRR